MLGRLRIACQALQTSTPGLQRSICASLYGPVTDAHSAANFSSEAPASSVKELKTDQEYRSVLQEAAKTNALSVFDYTASWCGPCRMISPVVDKLSTEYADENVTFYKVDIDRETVQESVRDAGVASVPTFSFYRGGKMIATFSGADRRQLENNLVNLVSLGG